MEEVAAPPPSPPPPLDRHNNKDLSSTIAKGKRTKRYRHHSPVPFAPTDHNNNNNNNNSPVIASSEESTTTEDFDIARCLILLAQGRFSTNPPHNNNNNSSKKRPIEDTCTTNNNNAYTCKTCGRSFPSFQALGGHRTSHKKFKIEKKQPASFFSDEEDFPSPSTILSSKKKKLSNSSLSLQLNSMIPPFSPSPSPRVHQCSYCGAEFTSGQALGGHMRKHRSVPMVNNRSSRNNVSIIEEEYGKIARDDDDGDDDAVLCLDLNLPAPAEDHDEGGIVARQQQELIGDVRRDHESNNEATALVLANTNTATTPLVDCHY